MTDTSAANASMPEMSVSEFIELLRRKQIQIRADEGRLKVSAPAGAINASLQAELKRKKPALLELLSHWDTIDVLVPLSDHELKKRIPLTPAQQGMWLIEHFNPGNVAYNISEAFRVEQPVSLEIL